MALEGTLSDFSLPDIFQLIGIQHKTGVLTLSCSEATVRVYFRDGLVINADSMRQGTEDRLGTVLVRTGRITDDQLEDALKTQRETLQQLGHILVSRGYLTAEDLADSLRMQATQVIYRLFRWKEGEYHFDQDAAVDSTGAFEPLSSESILMEGVRMLDEWPIIESRITSRTMVFKKLHPGGSVEIVEDAESIDRDDDSALKALIGGSEAAERTVQLTAMEQQVYAKINGRRTVQEIADHVSLYEFDACKCIYEMAERGLLAEVSTGDVIQTAGAPPRREVSPAVVKGLYVVLSVWMLLSAATIRFNPLAYWGVPPTSNMKLDSYRAAKLRLRLEKVSLSLEAFHVASGSYPAGLLELVEAGLVEGRDVAGPDGAPLTYELQGAGFLLAYRGGSRAPASPIEPKSVE